MQTCQVLRVCPLTPPHPPFFFCVCREADVCVYTVDWQREAGSRCLYRCQGSGLYRRYMFSERKLPSLCHRCPPPQLNATPSPSCCLTTTQSDPFYLFIYLLNYLLIPSFVWPFNDPPGGAGDDGAFTLGTDDHLLHLLGKIKTNARTLWAFMVCAKEVKSPGPNYDPRLY